MLIHSPFKIIKEVVYSSTMNIKTKIAENIFILQKRKEIIMALLAKL